jgi:hypothetical protein
MFNFEPLIELVKTMDLETLKLVGFVYVGLLWFSIIIWVTRDAVQRSNNLLFQAFAILLNILIPILGVLLYLILRPSKTNVERYYEELEHKLLLEGLKEEKPAEKTTHHKKKS